MPGPLEVHSAAKKEENTLKTRDSCLIFNLNVTFINEFM